MSLRNLRYFLALVSAPCFASVIQLPGGSVTIPGLSTTGVSFTFSGTLTDSDFLNIIQTGNPCLQSPASGPQYCTNGGGVVTTAGTSPVGAATTFVGTFNGTPGTWDFGSVIMEISGEGAVQVFAASPANGLGSATPPLSLSVDSSLAALGFPSFSVLNPTITFLMADNLYTDNSGSFVLTQAPEPATLFFVAPALLLLAAWKWRSRASRSGLAS